MNISNNESNIGAYYFLPGLLPSFILTYKPGPEF